VLQRFYRRRDRAQIDDDDRCGDDHLPGCASDRNADTDTDTDTTDTHTDTVRDADDDADDDADTDTDTDEYPQRRLLYRQRHSRLR
jgi:hypothetical protein